MEFKQHLGKEGEGEGEKEGEGKGEGESTEPLVYKTRAFIRIFSIFYFLSQRCHFYDRQAHGAFDTRSVELNLSFKGRWEPEVLDSPQI